jgi:hypothetical protein
VRTAVAGLVSTAAVVLSGCGGNDLPAVAVTAVPSPVSAACQRFADALPGDLGDGLPRRDTTPASQGVAAYGDPPVVVRCGAPATTAFEQGKPLYDVNGVDWFAEEGPDAVTWSTPRAFVNVQVVMPRAWQGDRLAYLTDAVKATR